MATPVDNFLSDLSVLITKVWTKFPKSKIIYSTLLPEVKRNANGEIMDINPSSHGASGTYTMERHRYTHANCPHFHRLVVTVQGTHGNYIPFAFVQYRFDGNEHFVRNKPHGNAKFKDPFIPTKKSTLEKLTAAVKSQGAKRAVHEVEVAVGGMYADSASSLPRNERQARYIKSKDKETSKSDPVSAFWTCSWKKRNHLFDQSQLTEILPSLYCSQMSKSRTSSVVMRTDQIHHCALT